MRRVLNIDVICKVIGINMLVMAGALISCTIVALIYSEDINPFVFSSLICLICAMTFLFIARRSLEGKDLNRKDAYFTVTLSWLILVITGALPYSLSGTTISFVDALFESVSGFSTTGASIFTDVEIIPRSILFWRSFTHWIGGIGIIILVIIIMPSLKIGGYHLLSMESSLQEKIKPRSKSISYRLLSIYITLTLLEIIFLLAGGMNLFDSICHSFGTIATGGFSTKNSSMANYSPYIQYVVMIFMLLAGINFTIYYYLIKSEFTKIKENSELWFYLSVVGVIGMMLTYILIMNGRGSLELCFRESLFQIISIITCTGFASADYLQWPIYGWMIIFFAMFLGGSAGSTAGGIKMVRHLILLKNMRNLFKKQLHSNAILPVRINKRIIPNSVNDAVLSFIILYLLIFAFGTLFLAFTGVDLESGSSAVATCMAGIGPGIGSVGPVANFAHLPALAKIILSCLMLLGRLEIYTVLILFTRGFWSRGNV